MTRLGSVFAALLVLAVVPCGAARAEEKPNADPKEALKARVAMPSPSHIDGTATIATLLEGPGRHQLGLGSPASVNPLTTS